MSFIAKIAASALLAAGLAGATLAAERWTEIPDPPAMPEPVESGTAPVNGIDMHYAVYGSGEPVLLIHGGLGHADLWAH